MSTITIDCGTCAVRDIACADCIVSVLMGVPSEEELSFDAAEQAAIGALTSSGLVPPLRLVPQERACS